MAVAQEGRLQGRGRQHLCLVGQVSFMWSLLGTNSLRANKDKFKKHMDDMLDVVCLVLATITLELQKQQEYVVSYEMIQNLKEILKGNHFKRGTRPLKTYFNAK
ncbi:hypothetical protein V6N12_049343 [Hibiscus sabdariffa]|uniref:Uncharacterized protein n=1 Tax=Hibiscus sabdariffa TaxID=183260 RepID=A0ABR2CB17_9ROSI